MNNIAIARAVRGLALLIALAAVIDPSFASNRASRPDVSVIQASVADSTTAQQVAQELSRSFTVLRSPFAGAAATVVVGNSVPPDALTSGGIKFGVAAVSGRPRVTLRRVDAPAHAAVDARVSVSSVAEAREARGKQLELLLLANGVVVDRVSKPITADTVNIELPLSYVPASAGVVTLRVEAKVAEAPATASADVVVEIRDRKWAVLFFDPRPSWMSTFVRRAVERDPRFAVTSRVVTSTSISTDAGQPPASLYEPAVMELYDAIVVGAPDALSERDVQGLERFLRRRGGSVVLLFDGNRRGAYERLAPVGAFTNTSNAAGTIVSGAETDSVALRATEWMWPTQLPVGATVLASSGMNSANSAPRHPLVWSMSAGAGRVIVSGALDSWKFRDAAQSGFERFWQRTIAQAADAALTSVELLVPNTPVEPGATVAVALTSRVAALADGAVNATGASTNGTTVRSTATLQMQNGNRSVNVRVLPSASRGEFEGTFVAPVEPGIYRLNATADGANASAAIVVSDSPRRLSPAEPDILAAWVAGEGGRLLSADRVGELASAIEGAVQVQERRELWHPLRSPWWFVPFALSLAYEWWVRRRRGKA